LEYEISYDDESMAYSLMIYKLVKAFEKKKIESPRKRTKRGGHTHILYLARWGT